LLEFWRTWCSACRKQTPILNEFQKKYADDLVIISITGETEEDLARYKGPKKENYLVIDKAQSEKAQQGVTEARYGVFGWPHVVLLEPEDRVVVWKGFPLQQGYELSAEKLEKYFAVYKKSIASKK